MIFNQKKGYSTDFFGPYISCFHCHPLSLAEHDEGITELLYLVKCQW